MHLNLVCSLIKWYRTLGERQLPLICRAATFQKRYNKSELSKKNAQFGSNNIRNHRQKYRKDFLFFPHTEAQHKPRSHKQAHPVPYHLPEACWSFSAVKPLYCVAKASTLGLGLRLLTSHKTIRLVTLSFLNNLFTTKYSGTIFT